MFSKIFSFILLLFIRFTVKCQNQNIHDILIGSIFYTDESHYHETFINAIEASNSKNNMFQLKVIYRFIAPDDNSLAMQTIACELTSQGVAAIFGPNSRVPTDVVAVVCNYTGIPHIKYDHSREETLTEKSLRPMTLNLFPSLPLMSKAYADIIGAYGWKSFILIYEQDEALVRLQDILQLHGLSGDEIKIKKFSKDEDFRILWKSVKHSGERRIILDCSPDIMKEVVNTSLQYKMMDQFNHLFLSNVDTHTGHLNDIYNANFKANITSVRLGYLGENSYPLRISLLYDAIELFTLSLTEFMHSGEEYSDPNIQNCGLEDGRTEKWEIGPILYDLMKKNGNLNGTYYTKNIQFNEYGERISFDLELYRPMVGAIFALWNMDGQIIPISQSLISNTQTNKLDYSESRRHYRVATKIVAPYLMWRKAKDGEILQGNQRFEGYCVDLIHKLSESSGFDYTFELVEDNANGNYNPETKEWNGIIRQLIDHRAEIGICDLTITQSRREAVDFTVPFMSLGISILFYKKPPTEKDLFAFLLPFSVDVWIYMATFLLVISLLNTLIGRVARNEWENPHPCNENPTDLENKWNIRNTTWLTLGSIMGQGCDILPRTAPLRLVISMWWFFALMMLNSYTANLAAFLTFSRIENDIGSINDLAEQKKIQFGTMRGGSTESFFKESNDSVFRLAWSKMKQAQPSAFTDSNENGVERVKKNKGTYAFLMETTSLEYNVEQNCDLLQVGNQIGEKHYGLAVPIGADYRSNLSVAILKLGEKGELFELKKKWWKNKNNTCEKLAEADGSDLSVKELGGVFLVLLGGIITAYILGICEFLWNIQQIAVEEKITPYEALKSETLFALKFWVSKKPVRTANSETCTETQSMRSEE